MNKIIFAVCFLLSGHLGIAQTNKPVPKSRKAIVSEALVVDPQKAVELQDSSVVMAKPDLMPEFKGGIAALRRYLGNNLNYPQDAVDNDVQGQVIVEFTVCEDGRLCNEKIIKGIGNSCDKEALRVVKAMPPWQPGIHNGKPVKAYYRQPIVFRLMDDVPAEKENK